MTPTAWAHLSFAAQFRYSLQSQPRVTMVAVRVGGSQPERQALIASLNDVLRRGPPSHLRLTTATGEEDPLPDSLSAAFLTEAILDRGRRLSWSFDARVDEATAQIATLAYRAAHRFVHGANAWVRGPAGRLTLSKPTPALPARQMPPLGNVPEAMPTPPVGCTVELFAPPRSLLRPVAAILLPLFPTSPTGMTDVHRLCALRLTALEQAGVILATDERNWLITYEAQRLAGEAEHHRRAVAKQEEMNRAQHDREKAQKSNHERRIERLAVLHQRVAAGSATPKEQASIPRLVQAIARDARHQTRIDRQLSQAVEARADLVTQARSRVSAGECTNAAPPIETAKGAFLVYPQGFDPRHRSAVAAWMVGGFHLRRSKVTEPVVDFQISCSHASALDRAWIAYVVRRLSWACGRDPDRDVLAATHEPDRHAPSKVDGAPIHVHAHVTFRVCDDQGRTWRCANVHLLIQRELEAINRERGWGLTTSAVAKGKQAYWYTAPGSQRIGWTIDGEFTATESAAATRAVACERVPSDPQRRPGAGIIVWNAQHTARRQALRRADARRLAAAGKRVMDVMQRLRTAGVSLPTDERGLITLDYYSGAARAQVSSPLHKLLAELSQVVLQRDRIAVGILCARIDYYAQNQS